jgi:ribose 5-phosphate isomerase B
VGEAGTMGAMRIHIASDHAGYEFKQILLDRLRDEGHEVLDHGAFSYDPGDDYPAFCISAGEAVVADEGSLGIVIGGSGNGEQMAANKVVGVRAALAWNVETARLTRAHNDANIVSVGWRQHGLDEAVEIVEAFLEEPFSGDERHQRRIDQVAEYEEGRKSVS